MIRLFISENRAYSIWRWRYIYALMALTICLSIPLFYPAFFTTLKWILMGAIPLVLLSKILLHRLRKQQGRKWLEINSDELTISEKNKPGEIIALDSISSLSFPKSIKVMSDNNELLLDSHSNARKFYFSMDRKSKKEQLEELLQKLSAKGVPIVRI